MKPHFCFRLHSHTILYPPKKSTTEPQTMCEKKLQLITKTPERLHRRQFGVFIANPNVPPNLAPAPPTANFNETIGY